MLVERRPRYICNRQVLVLEADFVILRSERAPHQSGAWVLRRLWLPPLAQCRPHQRVPRWAISAEQENRRRAVPRDVRARGVEDTREINVREDLLNQPLSERALQEAIGVDQADKSASFGL